MDHDLSIETQGIRTHFWLERTYRDISGREHWQSDALINEKLWGLTQWANWDEVQAVFPSHRLKDRIKRIWNKGLLAPLLDTLLATEEELEAVIKIDYLPWGPFGPPTGDTQCRELEQIGRAHV